MEEVKKRILQEYYVDYIGKGNLSTSAAQVVEKLSRILDVLRREYGVRFGDTITGLTSAVLLKWYRAMVSSGLAMTTRNNYVVILNPFFRWCVLSGYLPRFDALSGEEIYSVVKTHRLPREEDLPQDAAKKPKRLTDEQVVALMRGLEGPNKERDRAILALFLASAIRETELCEATLASVLSQPRGQIYIRRKGGAYKQTEVAEFFYPYLDAYLKVRGKADLSEPLFLTQKGTPFDRKTLYALISRKEKRLGLPSGVHILRHTAISSIGSGGDIVAARDIANHRSFTMTNRYSHSTPQERAQAINSLSYADSLKMD